MNRRDVLQLAALAGSASGLLSGTSRSAVPAETSDAKARQPARQKIIDTNVSLFRWPFRRLPLDADDALVAKLRALGVTQAWAGSFEGLLHRDVTGVNRRLAEVCGRHPELVPVGSINPELPDWEQDLRRCIEDHHMPGIRLSPNYHGYTLSDPCFTRVLRQATQAGLFVQIALAMEDTRTQHPLLRAADVDVAPLPELIRAVPGARVQLLNHRLRPPVLDRLAKVPGLSFDTARVEGTDGVPALLQRVGRQRVMFGSHAPFLIPEAALIRIHESGEPGEDGLRAVLSGNAERMSGAAGRGDA